MSDRAQIEAQIQAAAWAAAAPIIAAHARDATLGEAARHFEARAVNQRDRGLPVAASISEYAAADLRALKSGGPTHE